MTEELGLTRVAGVQMNVRFADKQANLARIESGIREAAKNGARLVVFPECALTGYCFETREAALELAESIPGACTEFVYAICAELGVSVVFGMLEFCDESLFNACVLIGPQGVISSYRKVHLPFLGVDSLATPGDRAFGVAEAGGLRVGMNICYDFSFPEAARSLALAGADVVVLPTNWPNGAECAAEVLPRARALENRVYYLAVNRVGTEGGFQFIGSSIICDPDGEILALAGPDEETILYGNLDPAIARQKRIVRVPDKHMIDRMADRRPEMYGKVTDPI
jgi:predicted amidohydrolase